MIRSARSRIAATAVVIGALFMLPTVAHAQGWGDRLKKKAAEAAKRATEARVEQKSAEATNAAMDRAEEGVEGKTDQSNENKETGEGGGQTPASPGNEGAQVAKPGEGIWANYDFRTGDVPLFVDDFADDEVGSFPRRLTFTSGSIDLVEWQGGRWISSPGQSEFRIPLPQTLPERFTVEFDFAGGGEGTMLAFDGRSKSGSIAPGVDVVELGATHGYIKSNERNAGTEFGVRTEERPVHIALQVDGSYAKLYANERRIANVPNANLGRSNQIYVFMIGWSNDSPRMITNIRIMAGGKKLYDALASSGRVSTQGIYFDTGSDRLRPESTPTLEEIAAMLGDHPELRLTIEGHTDNVGDAAANKKLSAKRAAAVKEALVRQYQVDGARLETVGFGSEKPAAPNTTPEGRARNRRVELVKG